MPELWVVHEFHRRCIHAVGTDPTPCTIYFNLTDFRGGKIEAGCEVQTCVGYERDFAQYYRKVRVFYKSYYDIRLQGSKSLRALYFRLANPKIETLESTLISIQPSGHQLLLEFTAFSMRTLFGLHGQLVVSTEDAFNDIVNQKSQIHVRWQVAVRVYGRPGKPIPLVLVFADYNKIGHIS